MPRCCALFNQNPICFPAAIQPGSHMCLFCFFLGSYHEKREKLNQCRSEAVAQFLGVQLNLQEQAPQPGKWSYWVDFPAFWEADPWRMMQAQTGCL